MRTAHRKKAPRKVLHDHEERMKRSFPPLPLQLPAIRITARTCMCGVRTWVYQSGMVKTPHYGCFFAKTCKQPRSTIGPHSRIHFSLGLFKHGVTLCRSVGTSDASSPFSFFLFSFSTRYLKPCPKPLLLRENSDKKDTHTHTEQKGLIIGMPTR